MHAAHLLTLAFSLVIQPFCPFIKLTFFHMVTSLQLPKAPQAAGRVCLRHAVQIFLCVKGKFSGCNDCCSSSANVSVC